MTLTADERAWDDDDEYEPPDPWEIGEGAACCCEAMLGECDAAEPWCTYNPEYREAMRHYESRRVPPAAQRAPAGERTDTP